MTTAMVIRKNGLGDVLYAEPFARSIAQQYDLKGRKIFFATIEHAVFKNHPLIKSIHWDAKTSVPSARPKYNLDGVYETIWKRDYGYKREKITPDDRLPLIPSLYFEKYEVGVPSDGFMPKIYLGPKELEYGRKMMMGKWVVIDPGYNRRYTFLKEEFEEVIRAIHGHGYKVARIGVGEGKATKCCHYNDIDFDVDMDLRGKTTKRQMFALVNACRFYIGIESSPLVVAQALHKPGILLNGMVPAESVLIPGCRILPHKCSHNNMDAEAVVNLVDGLIKNVALDQKTVGKKKTGIAGDTPPQSDKENCGYEFDKSETERTGMADQRTANSEDES